MISDYSDNTKKVRKPSFANLDMSNLNFAGANLSSANFQYALFSDRNDRKI